MTPKPARPNERRIGRRSVLIGAAAALVPTAAFGGYQAWSVLGGLGKLQRTVELPGSTPAETGDPTNGTPQDPAAGEAVDMMLLGSDTRDPNAEDGRSDTIMMLHLSADRKDAYLISFPRDMWVNVPGHGNNKINAAYSYGGTSLLASTLNELTGTEIDHAAVIDFSGFSELTQAVGGVTITNDQEFSSHGHHYPEGEITLAGDQALWYVRERYALVRGDFDRAANQRKVVKALVAKVAGPSTLANPAKLADVINRLARYVTVDRGLTDRAVLGLASSMKTAAKDLVTLQAPVSGTGMIAGQSVDIVDPEQMRKMGRALQDDSMSRYVHQQKAGQ